MFKLYNNNFDFSTFNFNSFFSNVDSSLSKNQKNFLSDFFTSLISSNSVNFDKISILSYKYHSSFFKNLLFTKNKFNYNLTIGKSDEHEERWFLISNVEPNRSKRYYSYRFGSIESKV